MLGLGLWYLVPATLAVKLSMFAIRVAIYVRAAPARDRTGFLAFWGLIAFLLAAYAGIAGGALFAGWARWADRHRGQKP